MRTNGLHPKVFYPLLAQLIGIAANWVATGHFDRVILAQAIVAGATTILGVAAPPAPVTVDAVPQDSEPVLASTKKKR